MDGYSLTKKWFEFAMENTDIVSPIHGILYLWIVEQNNRLGWIYKFDLPTSYSMQAIGVKNWKTYKKAFDDLVEWGFIKVITKSINQHTANVVAIVNNTVAPDLLMYKIQKHCRSTARSTVDKIKQEETIQTIKKKEMDKPSSPKSDFINSIIEEFRNVFPDYKILTIGKERSMASKLFELWKKQNPDFKTDEILKSLHNYFERCKNIPDDWHKNKMSLSHMVSQYNEIQNIFNNPRKKKKPLNPVDFDITEMDFTKKLSDE